MKIIERYFAGQFLTAFFLSAAAFVFFFLVFDLFSRLNLIIDGTIPPESVIEYYFSMIPVVFIQLCPIAVLLSTMYTLSSMAKHNELIAAVGCGKHPLSIFAVFLLIGLLISGLSVIINEKTVPEAARRAHEIRFGRMEDDRQIWENRLIYGSENRRFFISRLDISDNTFSNFEITKFSREGAEIMKFQAREGVFEDGKWNFSGVILRFFEEDGTGVYATAHADSAEAGKEGWTLHSGSMMRRGERAYEFQEKEPGIEGIPETPGDFTVYRLRYDEMDFGELRNYIARLRRAGFDPRPEIIALHSKISTPLASLVLMIVGISFSAKQNKGGFLIGLGAALGLALAYYLILNTGQMLGETLLDPAAGAWLANILFFIPGVFFLIRARHISC